MGHITCPLRVLVFFPGGQVINKIVVCCSSSGTSLCYAHLPWDDPVDSPTLLLLYVGFLPAASRYVGEDAVLGPAR